MMVRLDLADGREDGRIRPQVARGVPRCNACDNPVNPKRSECVYCGTAITAETLKAPPRPRREMSCELCQVTFEEREGFFSEYGLVCAPCHGDPERVVKAKKGTLSLVDGRSDGALSFSESGQLELVDEP